MTSKLDLTLLPIRESALVTAEEYRRAIRHAAEQAGPVVADIVCGGCGGRRIGTVSRRPRGLYLVSQVDDLEIVGLELILRAHHQGKPWKHLVPEEWTEAQVEQLISWATGQPDYKPRTAPVRDSITNLITAAEHAPGLACPHHSRLPGLALSLASGCCPSAASVASACARSMST